MSDPFLSQIKIVSWAQTPRGFAGCNGQFLPINQNQALFSLLGITYGGNGQTTFALPNLQGRVPMHFQQGVHNLGEVGGENQHTITMSEMPEHNHIPMGLGVNGTQTSPTGRTWAIDTVSQIYSSSQPNAAMNPGAITNTGGSQPHENRSPYLTLNFVIALIGIFPSRN